MIGVGSTAHPWLPPPMETRRTPGSSSAHRPGWASTRHRQSSCWPRRGRARAAATDVIFRRYLPRITRWARGRLPRYARDMLDTDDLVQDTVFQTLKRLLVVRAAARRRAAGLPAPGGRQPHSRRSAPRRPPSRARKASKTKGHVDEAASPLDEAIGREAVARYEAALERLKPEERQAIILRVELQLPYAQIADEMRKPSRRCRAHGGRPRARAARRGDGA